MNRRTLLRRTIAAGVALAAGCAGDGGEPSPTSTPGSTATPERTTSATDTSTPEAAVTVTVGAGGSLRFEPDSFGIGVGDTVHWLWEAGGHNVKPSSIPDDAAWSGTPGGAQETFEAGYSYVHTFDTAGEYEYHCAPHQSAGMTGSFTVE